jgi:hypothetical protein
MTLPASFKCRAEFDQVLTALVCNTNPGEERYFVTSFMSEDDTMIPS